MTPNQKTMIRILAEVSTERPAIVGWLGGWVGIVGSLTLERATQWTALIAGMIGVASASLAVVYTSIRIIRLLKNPDSKE